MTTGPSSEPLANRDSKWPNISFYRDEASIQDDLSVVRNEVWQ